MHNLNEVSSTRRTITQLNTCLWPMAADKKRKEFIAVFRIELL